MNLILGDKVETHYTPGPWTVVDAVHIETEDGVAHVCEVTTPDDYELAMLETDEIGARDLEAEATARLIAQAPRLHMALEMAMRLRERYCGPQDSKVLEWREILRDIEGC